MQVYLQRCAPDAIEGRNMVGVAGNAMGIKGYNLEGCQDLWQVGRRGQQKTDCGNQFLSFLLLSLFLIDIRYHTFVMPFCVAHKWTCCLTECSGQISFIPSCSVATALVLGVMHIMPPYVAFLYCGHTLLL